jgi:hypothetical protein
VAKEGVRDPWRWSERSLGRKGKKGGGASGRGAEESGGSRSGEWLRCLGAVGEGSHEGDGGLGLVQVGVLDLELCGWGGAGGRAEGIDLGRQAGGIARNLHGRWKKG